jgi:hypothetical protein
MNSIYTIYQTTNFGYDKWMENENIFNIYGVDKPSQMKIRISMYQKGVEQSSIEESNEIRSEFDIDNVNLIFIPSERHEDELLSKLEGKVNLITLFGAISGNHFGNGPHHGPLAEVAIPHIKKMLIKGGYVVIRDYDVHPDDKKLNRYIYICK